MCDLCQGSLGTENVYYDEGRHFSICGECIDTARASSWQWKVSVYGRYVDWVKVAQYISMWED